MTRTYCCQRDQYHQKGLCFRKSRVWSMTPGQATRFKWTHQLKLSTYSRTFNNYECGIMDRTWNCKHNWIADILTIRKQQVAADGLLPMQKDLYPYSGTHTELLIFLLYKSSRWLQTDFYQCEKTSIHTQGDHLSGKPENVREFVSCQGNVRDFTKYQGNIRKKILSGKSCRKLL